MLVRTPATIIPSTIIGDGLQAAAMRHLRHRVGRDRAGEKQENADKRQLHADQGEAFMDNQPEDDEPDAGRIHHADRVGPAVKVGQSQEPETSGQKRHNAGSDQKA